MLFEPESVLGMARTIEPATEAMRDHAKRIAEVGFDPSHAGQDYLDQGQKLAVGVNGIVTMLNSWSDASGATVDALRQVVAATSTADERNRAGIEGAEA
ncbi:hypothetical protein [Nocardia pseudobrasiliensis]|uniref:Excreted virulence factor EspC (Type VII ESX diderm) n=1 Tax=Nocardia pseudobrasiliensis TaxID=45979 RepID=A0A370I777_9NOCA|nr:hypothetical protein [Nocardia pseudobrasiliensis]RDI66586.1 hypothetical protein DFR76_104336 [Nocardia pseudobrasiliensis]